MKYAVIILGIILILALLFMAIPVKSSGPVIDTPETLVTENLSEVSIKKLSELPSGTWQAEVSFPDWKGYIDDTLAMNSMYSFDGFEDQGKLYFVVPASVNSYELFINNKPIDSDRIKDGIYEIDFSKISKNGTNTIQVSNILFDNNFEDTIKVYIPFAEVIESTLEEVGLRKEPFEGF